MGLRTYYNEIDPFAAAWLRNLIKEKLIPDGDVDERSIADVQPVDLKDYVQCHFFAGIGGWAYALQLAEWPDDKPVWTGSCPCQPFSVAGRGKGTADERHLWPEFYRLIREHRPSIVFGEQVASRAGREWLAGVFDDLEGVGYAGAGADLCAAGVGAPHIRQRLYWVARSLGDTNGARADAHAAQGASWSPIGERGGDVCSMANASRSIGQNWLGEHGSLRQHVRNGVRAGGGDGAGYGPARGSEMLCENESQTRFYDMADADSELRDGRGDIGARGRDEHSDRSRGSDMADADDAGQQGRAILPECADELSPWSRGVEWRRGADGKERRVKSGVRLLVDGVSNRVGRLRGYGNAIVPQVAAAFIKASL